MPEEEKSLRTSKRVRDNHHSHFYFSRIPYHAPNTPQIPEFPSSTPSFPLTMPIFFLISPLPNQVHPKTPLNFPFSERFIMCPLILPCYLKSWVSVFSMITLYLTTNIDLKVSIYHCYGVFNHTVNPKFAFALIE